MVEWIGVAAATMVCAVVIQHLGLTVEMAEVARKIASCYKCCTFWSCIAALLLSGAGILPAVALSILMAFLSHYFALLLMVLQKLYDRLWKRINRKQENRHANRLNSNPMRRENRKQGKRSRGLANTDLSPYSGDAGIVEPIKPTQDEIR